MMPETLVQIAKRTNTNVALLLLELGVSKMTINTTFFPKIIAKRQLKFDKNVS